MFKLAGSARFERSRISIVVLGLLSGKLRVLSLGNVPNKEGSVNGF